MKKSTIIFGVTFFIALGMLAKAFLFNEDIKMYLLLFFTIGLGLGLLRLFVNNSIKKMKGKSWKVKVLFFSVLLGLGLPFQNWFRKDVIMSMDSTYLVGSIMMLVLGAVFLTTFLSSVKRRKVISNI